MDLVDKRAAGAMQYSQLAVGEIPLSEAEGTETYPGLSNGACVQLFAERYFFIYEALGDYNPSLLNFDDKKQFFFFVAANLADLALSEFATKTNQSTMLTLFHTAAANEALFANILNEIAPDIPAQHIVDDSILPDVRAAGLTDQIKQRVTDTILNAIKTGSDVVLCTCSTIGGCAEDAQQFTAKPVQRVDRAMAEKAVATGSRIIVAATLASTLPPTCALVLDAATKEGKEIELIEVFCASAWPKFEAGDRDGYFADIAAELRKVAHQGDVVVLAQASMAGATAFCTDLPIPVLSSPRLGLEAAVSAYRLATKE